VIEVKNTIDKKLHIAGFAGATTILYVETHRPNTNRHVYTHKYLYCARIDPATSGAIVECSVHYRN
jgi:hypothetical protein